MGSCRSDVAIAAFCSDGAWTCAAGTVDPRGCGGCTGFPPFGYVCGDGGWVSADAGSGGGGE
jgi:hypothetical protein